MPDSRALLSVKYEQLMPILQELQDSRLHHTAEIHMCPWMELFLVDLEGASGSQNHYIAGTLQLVDLAPEVSGLTSMITCPNSQTEYYLPAAFEL
ncbi:unnamed protein product [Sphagnum balticum]